MRIPLYKTYRAFSELDDLTDAQCELLMRRVQLQRGVTFAWTLLAVVLFFSLSFIIFHLLQEIDIPVHIMNRHATWVFAGGFVAVVGAPLGVIVCVRDVVLRIRLKRAIQYEVDRVRCLSCRYILIGQVAYDGRLDCPECGSTFSLKQLGITEGDLLPPGETNPDTVGTVSAG